MPLTASSRAISGLRSISFSKVIDFRKENQNDFKITSEVMKNSSSTTKLAVQDLEEKKWYLPNEII